MDETNLEAVMSLIMYGGEAKSCAMEAIQAAKTGKFDEAKESLRSAHEALTFAHNSQTAMLTAEAQGQGSQLSLLMVHAQDHLMTSLTFVDLAQEVVDVYVRMADKS